MLGRTIILVTTLIATNALADPKPKAKPAQNITIVLVNNSNGNLGGFNLKPADGTHKFTGNTERLDRLSDPPFEMAIAIAPGDYDVQIRGSRNDALFEQMKMSLTESTQFEVQKGGKVVQSKPDPKYAAKLLAKHAKENADNGRDQNREADVAAANRKAKRHWQLDHGDCQVDMNGWCGTISYANGSVSGCIPFDYEDDNTKDKPLPADLSYVAQHADRPVFHLVVKKANVKYRLKSDCKHFTVEPLD
jgi:hypothetical protein